MTVKISACDDDLTMMVMPVKAGGGDDGVDLGDGGVTGVWDKGRGKGE